MSNILLGGLIVLILELWIIMGFVILLIDRPKLNNAFETIIRMIAWPVFLWRLF